MSQNIKNKLVIYFIASYSPTEQERAEYDLIRFKLPRNRVVFRNASQVSGDEKPEECEAVAGLVPDSYAAVYNVIKLPPKAAPKAPASQSVELTAANGENGPQITFNAPSAETPPVDDGKGATRQAPQLVANLKTEKKG